jgi:DNA-binding NtrC family response regulator
MSSLIAAPPISANGLVPVVGVGLLVVSSNPDLRRDLIVRLQSDHWDLWEASSGAEALEKIDAGQVSQVLLDPGLPDLKVDEFKAIVQSQYPGVTVIPINPHTGQPIVVTPSPDSICFEIVRKIERGSPFRVGNVASTRPADDEAPTQNSLPGFIGMAPSVNRLCSMVRLVAQRDTTVLITGESGTGKDVVARALYQLGTRRLKPFVVINCAAIPEALLEAELFGFVKGAFTGARWDAVLG